VAQVLRAAGAQVRLVGKHEQHLSRVRERGIETILLDDWDRTPAGLVVEATGTARGVELGLAATRPRGTLVIKSTVADRVSLDFARSWSTSSRSSAAGAGRSEPALAALASNQVQVRSLVDARVSLEHAVEAVALAARPGTLKVLLEMP